MTSALGASSRPSLFPSSPELVTAGLNENHPLRGAVLALGNFDGFHLGHKALVEEAHRPKGRRPVAVMSCEPHPRSFFFQDALPFRLATPATKRMEMAQHGVDYIYSPAFDLNFAGLTPERFVDDILVASLGVTHVIAGPDFHFGRGRSGDMAMLLGLAKSRGFGVTVAKDITRAGVRVSSSLVRAAIEAGDMRGATELLGHGWLVETRRGAADRLELHPTLCRPRPGRYVARHLGSEVERDHIIEISDNGKFTPLGPYQIHPEAEIWRLVGQA